MIFQEKYDLDHLTASFFSDNFDLLILGGGPDSKDQRCCFVKNLINPFPGKVLYLRTDDNVDKLEYDLFDQNNKVSSADNLLLVPGLRKLLRDINIFDLNVCVDISCLQQGIIFLLAKIIVLEVRPKNFFAAYTEPKVYNYKPSLVDEEYDLSERIIGHSYAVPGFAKISRSTNSVLVASTGFEKQRLINIYEDMEPSDGLIPVVAFPSFTPGMDLTALFMNYKVLEDSGKEGQIRFCEAASPFAFYDMLKEIERSRQLGQEIWVAPLGTRPHCLGAAIFAAHHKDFHLIYDFPVEKSFRSSGVLKSNIYFLSSYLA